MINKDHLRYMGLTKSLFLIGHLCFSDLRYVCFIRLLFFSWHDEDRTTNIGKTHV